MKIAFLGSRGIPARYSGFETFYEQLGVRLAERGHQVTVYNRSHFIKDVKGVYKGVRLVTLPSVPSKHLDTITHTALSSLHALFQGYDIVYYCIVGNSPLCWLPRLTGGHTLLNVDGEDWARGKWGRFARWYQLKCERIATHTAHVLISDAHAVARRYREVYGHETIFAPYGANVQQMTEQDVLARWGLLSRGYVFYVGRLVPENGIDVLIEAFKGVPTDMKLVIVGDAPYAGDYKQRLHALGSQDDRVVFTGYAFGRDYQQLSSHAYLYVQPSGVDGTRPALLDQMGFGNCVVVRNTPVNMEVIGDCGLYFDRHDLVSSLQAVLARLLSHPEEVVDYRARVRARISGYYNWEWITDFYADLFARMTKQYRLISYDSFLRHRRDGSAQSMVLRVEDLPRADVLGVGVHAINMAEAVGALLTAAREHHRGYVCVTSVHGVIESQADPELRHIHNASLLTVPDGIPTVWTGHHQGFKYMGRVYGPDLMLALCRASVAVAESTAPLKHFFYGATPDVLTKLVANLQRQIPGMQVVGTYAPPFRTLNEAEEKALAQQITACRPDFFWVGLSTPKQEKFMARMAGRLDAAILLGVGAAFDILAGVKKDAPDWMKRAGLQWFFRLCQEPTRLWRRYSYIVPYFLWLNLLQMVSWRKQRSGANDGRPKT
ncbi:MAG: WecB/TagA/CpsF family glycosyltransferase [Kiritimatiellaeota bacterium]|nr:WecB/TagA/CpsF family glycosyltransferase [Kiritimatiellota bacterium]